MANGGRFSSTSRLLEHKFNGDFEDLLPAPSGQSPAASCVGVCNSNASLFAWYHVGWFFDLSSPIFKLTIVDRGI
jgi:hypothetical protein